MKAAVAFLVLIAVAAAQTGNGNPNECHLIDCQNEYKNSKEENCAAVATWKACVERQTPEQDGLCTSLTIAAAKKVVYLAEKTHGCNGANTVVTSITGSIVMAMVALLFRS